MLVINAFFENGKFVPESPVSIPEKTRATITIDDRAERMGRAFDTFLDELDKIDDEPLALPLERVRFGRTPEMLDKL
jgi:predicted DNA-binding antitoxin AbrB/MazE fold protein